MIATVVRRATGRAVCRAFVAAMRTCGIPDEVLSRFKIEPPIRSGGSPVSVEERVIEIVSEQMGVAKDQVTRDTSFVNDLGADSLDTVELVMAFEEEFSVEIPDDAAETIVTVGDAIRFLEKATAA